MGRFVSLSSINEIMTNCFVISEDIRKLFRERPVLTSQIDVSKLPKQPSSVMQIHLNQSANFGSLPLNACVTVTSSINR